MITLWHASRCLLAVILGYFAGVAISGLALVVFGVLLGHWWLSGCLVVTVVGYLHTVAAYRVSLAIAPPSGGLGRWVLVFPYWLLSASSVLLLGRLLLGEQTPCGSVEFMPAVSGWWCSFTFALGTIIGAGRITELASLLAERDAIQPSHVSTFEWRGATH